jgi:TonB family protein
MTSALVEPRPWSRRRWWGMVGLVFGVQLALIFWLGETSLAHRRPAAPGLTLKLAGSASAELLALHDPTLFALPHKQEMPTPTWWRTPQPELHEFAWPEPTNHPHLAIDQLGTAFNRLAETNAFGPLPLPAKPLPELTLPELPPLAISAPRSTLRLEWDQAPRRLLTPLELSSQENPEILSNSVVRIVVEAEGRPASVALLSGSGSKAADQQALELANAARFEPLNRNPAGTSPSPVASLTWGRMIFQWHTILPLNTNAPAAIP